MSGSKQSLVAATLVMAAMALTFLLIALIRVNRQLSQLGRVTPYKRLSDSAWYLLNILLIVFIAINHWWSPGFGAVQRNIANVKAEEFWPLMLLCAITSLGRFFFWEPNRMEKLPAR